MTLDQIIRNVEGLLGYRIDRSLLIQIINETMINLALSMRLTRTDTAYNGYLTRQPVQSIDVRYSPGGDIVTYTYVPRELRHSDDVPELPIWCHSAIVSYAAQHIRDAYDWRVAA